MSSKQDFMRQAFPRAKDIPGKPAAVVPFADWDYYYTHDPISWRAGSTPCGTVSEVIVPEGFVTDLASIPSVFWTVLPPAARYSYPAIIHDYLYWFQSCAREDADSVFKSAMQDMHVPDAKIAIIFGAVRLAGGHAWSANAEARQAGERRLLKRYPTRVEVTWDEWKHEPDVFV